MNFISLIDVKEDLAFSDYTNLKSLSLFSKYYREYYKEKFTDLSFVLEKNNKILGYVLCCVLDETLTLPDGGLIIELFDEVSQKEKKKIYTQILDHLNSLAETYKYKNIIIKDSLQNGVLSTLGELLFNRKFQSRLTFEMEIDYSEFSEVRFHEAIRRRYKPFINWGRRELKVVHLNKSNLDFEKFREFQDFHYKISGRKTRSDESWQIQYEMIKEGFGELALARYNNNLVAGSLFADYGDTSIYFTGVYERELFDFGVSHFLLYDGICRSHERGNTSKFSLGYFDTDIKDSKWYNIQFFKKGFCKAINPCIMWTKQKLVG